jgi:hypothetical protein
MNAVLCKTSGYKDTRLALKVQLQAFASCLLFVAYVGAQPSSEVLRNPKTSNRPPTASQSTCCVTVLHGPRLLGNQDHNQGSSTRGMLQNATSPPSTTVQHSLASMQQSVACRSSKLGGERELTQSLNAMGTCTLRLNRCIGLHTSKTCSNTSQ